jgi:hypothetical protein
LENTAVFNDVPDVRTSGCIWAFSFFSKGMWGKISHLFRGMLPGKFPTVYCPALSILNLYRRASRLLRCKIRVLSSFLYSAGVNMLWHEILMLSRINLENHFMKTLRTIALLLAATVSIGIQSCKKDSDNETTTGTTTDDAAVMQQTADDMAYAQETEYAMNDADNAMSYSGFGKSFTIDGAVIDSFMIDKKIVITYNGNDGTGRRHRSGKISIQLTGGAFWREKDATINIVFTDYTVKHNATGRTIKLNGTYTVSNRTGGTIIFMAQDDSIVQRMSGDMRVSFDNGEQRTWTISRDRTIGRNAQGYYISISGYGAEGSEKQIAIKGTGRSGRNFITVLSAPVVFSSGCSWNATSGMLSYKSAGSSIDVTYGVDASGNMQQSGCPYGYRMNWLNARGEAKVAVVSY